MALKWSKVLMFKAPQHAAVLLSGKPPVTSNSLAIKIRFVFLSRRKKKLRDKNSFPMRANRQIRVFRLSRVLRVKKVPGTY